MGIAESHLTGEQQLVVPGYTWVGHNRTALHHRARTGSGGVGFLIKDSLLQHVSVSVLDSTAEDVLWVQLRGTEVNFVFNLCVCYLPPEGSSRHVDAQEFYENLLGQVFAYNNNGGFYICGDLNSRIGDHLDFMEGVDELPNREVVDFKCNSYGEHLCDFLLSSSCCILNGRNSTKNDFTSFNSVGQSVVDYCFLPIEAKDNFTDFQVHRPHDLINAAGMPGVLESLRGLPDHGLLRWQMNWSILWSMSAPKNEQPEVVGTYTKFDLSGVNDDFLMSDSIKNEIRETCLKIKNNEMNQQNLDANYNEFCDIVHTEMESKLDHRSIKIMVGNSNKKRKVQQQWW